jgi:hypothetical protein
MLDVSMLSIVMLSVFVMSIFMMSVVMLSVSVVCHYSGDAMLSANILIEYCSEEC